MTRFNPFVLAIFALFLFATPVLAADTDHSLLPGMTPMDSKSLNNYAGGAGLSISNTNITNTATATADSYANTIDGSVATGAIANINVSGNSGLTSTITNTGNMVSISQSTAINVTLH